MTVLAFVVGWFLLLAVLAALCDWADAREEYRTVVRRSEALEALERAYEARGVTSGDRKALDDWWAQFRPQDEG